MSWECDGNLAITSLLQMKSGSCKFIYFIYLLINSGIEFNTRITQIQGSQQQQYKPEKERKGYK